MNSIEQTVEKLKAQKPYLNECLRLEREIAEFTLKLGTDTLNEKGQNFFKLGHLAEILSQDSPAKTADF